MTTVPDGEEAWRQLNDPAKGFDLAIIDMMMPRLDGFGLLERIRATSAISSLPVIFCTALSDRTTVGRAAQLGVGHYVVKPYRKAVVLEKLGSIESGLQRPVNWEDPGEICSRLGVPAEVLARLVSNPLRKSPPGPPRRPPPTTRRNSSVWPSRPTASTGACLNLGLSALSAELELMEGVIREEAAPRHRPISHTAPPEIAASLQRVRSHLERIAERFKPAV